MAGRYPPQWLDELRARADIVKVIGSYVTLKKNGHRYVGLCPFHNETAPSFSVDEQKQVYHCFGCKAGGSVIQFVMDIEHLEFVDAVLFGGGGLSGGSASHAPARDAKRPGL